MTVFEIVMTCIGSVALVFIIGTCVYCCVDVRRSHKRYMKSMDELDREIKKSGLEAAVDSYITDQMKERNK